VLFATAGRRHGSIRPSVINGEGMRDIRMNEVGPRDGLQHEAAVLSTNAKVAFVNALSQSGVAEIEVGSFVSPRAVPQLADSDVVFQRIDRRAGVLYSALVPNERGLARARAAAVDKIAVFTAASDTFNQRNIHCTVRESLERLKLVVSEAKRDGLPVRGYISTATHCPFEGAVAPSRVRQVMRDLLDLGVDEISLGDTIGKAAPSDVRRLLDDVRTHLGKAPLSLHFHDTYGMAIANVLTAWMDYGVASFDASAGGLGGCPYAPGASGNVATEDVVYALRACGASILVDERLIIQAAMQLGAVLNRPLSSRLSSVAQRQVGCEVVP
jgi:hydroxymethylglutaryl-CoA lyase